MKTDDDEVELSAYLDGELDTHQRTAIESAMLSNPALAERYRQLAAVRDLVANLPRPTLQEDFSSLIVARASSRVARPLLLRIGAGIQPLAMFVTTVAALILLSAGLALFANRRQEPRQLAPQPLMATKPANTVAPVTVRPNSDVPVAPPSTDRSIAESQPLESNPSPTPPTVAQQSETDLRADQEHSRIRALLDSPDLKHVFIVVDEIGNDAPDQVEGLVRRMPRISPDFGKITVSQGIVIDPRHPNKATVFALVMDQNELKQFRERLHTDFPEQVTETTPEPTVVTQLSEIGQVAILSGARATELATTPTQETQKSAIRRPTKPREPDVFFQNSPEFGNVPVPVVDRLPPPSADASTTAKLTTAPKRNATADSSTSTAEGGQPPKPTTVAQAEPSPESGRRSSSVVLVWVTSIDPARKGRY